MIGSVFNDQKFEEWLKKIGFQNGKSCMFCKVNDFYSVKLTPSVCSTVHEIQITEYTNKRSWSRWFDNEQTFMDYFMEIMAVHIVMDS